jgi:hypothetical protein
VRLMSRSNDDDPGASVPTIERVVDQITWTELNEFKHTSIPR